MLGRSRSRLRQDPASKLPVSPSRRRVTRSHSHDVEESRGEINSTGRHDGLNTREQSKALDPVVEESPFKTPHKTGFRYESSVIPESPEDVANISGTTIIPSEPETDFDPEMMLEALPDLERSGKSILDFLAPSTASPVMIVNKAKILSDPINTQSKRLRRLVANLDGEIKFFGNQTYIDAGGVSRTFSSAFMGRLGEFNGWGPEPIVQMANCARLAVEILLAGTSTNSQRQAIRNIERLFPLPFMTGIAEAGQEKAPGESALETETFGLALEIRKQSLIMQLEDNQGKPGFSPKSAVRLCFFTGLSRKSPLRGFNLPSLGGASGTLPAQYKDTVQNLYNDILLSETDDGMFDVGELRGAYLWKRFVLQAAQWIRKRTEEIIPELQKRMSAQEVHDAFFTSKHPSFVSTLGGSEAEPSVATQETEQETTQERNVGQEITALPELQHQRPESPDVQRGKERRVSSKPSYLNSVSIQRVIQRQERLRSETEPSEYRRQSDIVYPVSRAVNERPSVSRHRNSSVLPSSRPAQPTGPREIPPSFDDASTLLPDEPDITIGDDSQLAIENEGTQIEKFHSPPTIRQHIAPRRSEATSTDQGEDRMTLSQRVWEAAKTFTLTQSASGPSRNASTRFIDRQQHAARVSPIRDDDSQDTATCVEERTSRKRARSPDESEFDGDGNHFDYDSRPVDLERRRAEKPQRSRSKRPRLEGPEAPEDTENDANEDNDLEEPPHQVVQRLHSATASSQQSAKEPSSTARIRWSEAEDNRLLRLMSDHGPHWALIERQNQAQPAREGEVRIEDRNQGALKDRARNIKIAYYRIGRKIPKYLEPVTMKKKDYEKLEARGIYIHR